MINKSCSAVTEIIKRKSQLLGEEYELIKHKSGLRIYVAHKDFSATYAIFGTAYGSYDNCFKLKGEADTACVPEGIAHFLEHKMFEMENGKDAFEMYAETGAEANAYTSVDRTAYLFSCTSDFEKNLRILLEMVTKPYFTEETVKKEQGIIGEEIRMCEDRPWDALHYGLMRAIYKDSPARIPVAGTVESIAKITPELLYRCYNTFYDMSNMALCVCGNVDTDSIIAIADEMLPDSVGAEIERVLPEEDPQVFKTRETAYMQVSKPMFAIGVKDTLSDGGDVCHYETVRNLLCEALFGMSGELYSELYEDGLVGGYSTGYYTERGYSVLSICGDADDPDEVFRRFSEYASRCAENGVSDEQFIRARRVLYAQMARAFDSSSETAEALFSAFVGGEELFDCVEEIYKVEKSELDELAKKLFLPDRYAMCVVKEKE